MKKIRFSIVGTGAISESAHIPSLLAIPEAIIDNICDIDNDKLSFTSNKFSISKTFSDYKNAIHDDVDAVIIATDAPAHAEIALYAIEKNIPVFMEKPITVSVEDAKSVYLASKKKNVLVMVGYQLRHMANHKKLKQYADNEEIGKIYNLHIRAETLVIKPDETLLIDYGTHFFDLVRFYVGKKIDSVYCDFISNDNQQQIGATTVIKFHDCEYQVVVETYWVPNFNWSDVDRSVTFLGEHGKMSTKMSIPEITLLKTKSIRDKKIGPRTFMPKEASNVYMSMGDYAYQKQLEVFTNALLNNKEVFTDAYAGLMALKIADAALYSAKNNIVVKGIEDDI